jgi:hypothetical protein
LDFHDYACKVSAPDANFMLTKPSRRSWQVTRHRIGRIVVQSGAAGGATIADGVSRSGPFAFLLRNFDCGYAMSLNGQPVAAHDIAIFFAWQAVCPYLSRPAQMDIVFRAARVVGADRVFQGSA